MLFNSHPCADMIKQLQNVRAVRNLSWDMSYDYWTFIDCLLKSGNLRCKCGFVKYMRNCRYLDRPCFDVDDDIDRLNAEHLSESESDDDSDDASDDDSSSSIDSDATIIAFSRNDPRVQVVVQRLPRAS